ncbi:undecaprenyl diphosphate synthase family protein [Tissierella creatinophila]|uniref:Ditrans,polycis-undecaprenyl-diphosphate synthase ((2E,6E)-farnesyl-diphosphate specific) n=1 Tax=Tissierella creatinophila DSM 6911 TaxID=1123403 RepID=A0A1U7M550_TISCR|nr:undecaprenyl diphosphate synthase family protein [Tissierella creatinophila]OLS02318.1 ditrans,polycis-undecaprenyl-diphosphate synthase ((2E,6E)-farnesyl-diphosphate specific) [Tissierella creatinophila DSM 6911]
MRIPKHLAVIPDGNRRWAEDNGMTRDRGYHSGLNPGVEVFKLCQKHGIEELTFYGFTADNTKRPTIQRLAFTKACIDAVELLTKEDAELLVIGNTDSKMFPEELKPFTNTRKKFGKGGTKVNFLVNYDWKWDINNLNNEEKKAINPIELLKSKDISRVDLIIRWGGRRRLSGFLPLQAVYSDFFIVDDYWPDFSPDHFISALDWYNVQDITLGG